MDGGHAMFSSNSSQVSQDAVFVEDVFSTYLYTGNGSTQTITNGIDLAGQGGLVWIKDRVDVTNNVLDDTARGVKKDIYTNTTSAQVSGVYNTVTAFNSNGFSIGNDGAVNWPSDKYASWTFRKQAKFFDVVTYTGNGTTQTVPHNLGSLPGCIIAKRTDTASDWIVWHKGNSTNLTSTITGLSINRNNSAYYTSFDVSSYMTSTSFNPAYMFDYSATYDANINGATYVAYLFAHDAGGFGTAGTDNVISCGSFTSDSSGNFTPVNLGYEPQWLLIKRTNSTSNWSILDTMRGWNALNSSLSSVSAELFANTTGAESTGSLLEPNATGFGGIAPYNSSTFIYIAIRRGPMKTPTSGTSVFSPIAYAGTSSTQTQTANFPVDLFIDTQTTAASDRFVIDRLRGSNPNSTPEVETNTSSAESSLFNIGLDNSTGVNFLGGQLNGSGFNYILWAFRRAPSFMDVVCVTGTGSGATYNHNLGVVPELMFQKGRSLATSWESYTPLGKDYAGPKLDSPAAASVSSNYWTAPTSTTFKLQSGIDGNGYTYVAYLFASCPGVSKVGSYTGTGATQTISCGFAARFVLIKRTDSTGNWWVWDTTRGMVSGTDPRLAYSDTSAQTNSNWVYTNASGFQIVTTDATVNASGGSYLYLAIS
jgi:hypothetical protein